MKIINGKKIAQKIQERIKNQIAKREEKPGLTFILVGNDPASHTYVGMKKKACAFVGMRSSVFELPGDVSERALLDRIDRENVNPEVDGILVQMPLPKHISSNKIIEAVSPAKDVDGFHPVNVGKMLLGIEGGFLPCTPHGIFVLLQESGVEVSGKHVVILGRSNIVGKPLAALLIQKKKGANATVTIAHSGSKNVAKITRTADILIAAIGKPHFVKEDMVKEGAVIIDVGINRTEDGLTGDIDFQTVSKKTSFITPVPGGVGPMTIAMLLQNTLDSFLRKR